MINFSYTILYVSDVAASLKFYEQAFGFQQKMITPDQNYGELLTGSTTLSFASHTLAKSNLKDGYTASDPDHRPFGFEIGLATADVGAVLHAAIAAGGTLAAAPETKPWGQVVAYVKDPDGFLIEICTPLG